MALSSHIISQRCVPTPRLFPSPANSLQFHFKPTPFSTSVSNCTSFPGNINNKRITRTSNIIKAKTDQIKDEIQIKRQRKSMSLIDWVHSFIRPYVLRGTLFGLAGTVARTCMENPHSLQASNWVQSSFTTLAVLFTILLTDGSINQINNIIDIEIDKINKPHLSVASGEISINAAWALILGSAILSIGAAIILKSQAFLLFIVLHLAVGFIYSFPPFYTKKSTYGAILTIASMGGYIKHWLFCAGATTALGLPFQMSPSVIFLAIFTTAFGLAVGIMKDLSDIKGDKLHKVPTLASKYGLKFAGLVGIGILLLTYMGAAAAGLLFPHMFKQSVMVSTHFAIAHWVAFKAWELNKEGYNKEASRSFFSMMWNLLIVEYVIFPFI